MFENGSTKVMQFFLLKVFNVFFVILLLQRLYPASCLAAVQLVVQLPYRVAQPPLRVV